MKDIEIFSGKSFTDLLKDIHDTTLIKRRRIDELIVQLRAMITGPEGAVVLAPIIKEYLEVMVKNDEHLVKMAAIIQRIMSVEARSGGESLEDLLSDDEKQRILADAVSELEAEVKKLDVPENPVTESVA